MFYIPTAIGKNQFELTLPAKARKADLNKL